MNILDENIISSQCSLLRAWRNHFSHLGTDIGRRGMKDQPEVIPLLHHLRRATFFTHDLGFFDPSLRHTSYSLICLDVSVTEAAGYIRRFLRHPAFRAQGQRLGKVILIRAKGLRYWQVRGRREQVASWPKR